MNCCQCQGIEELFNERLVSSELDTYRRNGPNKSTRLLIQAILEHALPAGSLLDIGGGVGALQHALLEAGVSSASDVDASQAYLRAAGREAQRRGLDGRVAFFHGNFVEIADQIPPAEIVTLDRVICCYPDMQKLVDLSARRALRWYGLVFPRDDWWMVLGQRVANLFFRLQKRTFRLFTHPTQEVEAILTAGGLHRVYYTRTSIWQIVLYER